VAQKDEINKALNIHSRWTTRDLRPRDSCVTEILGGYRNGRRDTCLVSHLAETSSWHKFVIKVFRNVWRRWGAYDAPDHLNGHGIGTAVEEGKGKKGR